MHFQKGLKEDNKELENPYVWGNIQESLRMAQARAPADSSPLEVACLYSVPVRTFGQKCLFVCLCRMHASILHLHSVKHCFVRCMKQP